MNKRLELITLAGVASLAALPLLLNPGFLNTRGGGDSPFLLFRLHQLYSALAQGVFPVRWMPDAAFGLGYPFFNYYAALPLYVAALFKALGASYVLALKLTHLSGFLLAAFAMYGWMRASGANRAAAWLAAAAYTFAPFHLVNVYVRGDSLNEFWAFALYPLCLWAACRLNKQLLITNNSRNWLLVIGYWALPLALAYAALIFTHNISALIFTPFLGIYLLLAINPRNTHAKRAIRFTFYASAALALGIALSAFYWLPALSETEFAQLGAQTTGFFHYSNHFRGLNLIQPSLLFNYDIGSASTTPFAMGLAQTVLLALALILVGADFIRDLRGERKRTPLYLFLGLGLALSTFMLTRFSAPLWASLPLLSFTQFPWRFLSVQSLFASALTGLAGQFSIPNSKFTISLVGLCIANCALSIAGLRPDFVPIADVTAERLQTYEYFTGNIGTTIRHEYLPKWTQPRPYSSEEFIFGTASLKVLDGEASGGRLEKRAASQTWAVTVESDTAHLAVPLLYWPGWEARADGKPLNVAPADGLGWIAFDLPRGEHTVELKLGDTPTRRTASVISLAALLVAIALSQPWRLLRPARHPFDKLRASSERSDPERSRRGSVVEGRRAVWSIGGVIILIGLALAGRWLNAQAKPNGAATMDFDQLGYLHSAPVPFGNFDVLQNYNYSAETLRPGGTLAVSLLWQASGEATFNLELVSPAGHLLNLPRTIAQTSGPAKDYTVAALRLPDDLPTGVYLLRLSLIQDSLLAPALTSSGQPRGAIYLRPIRVVGAIVGAVSNRDVPLTQLTPALGLQAVTATQTDSSAVTVTLSWQAAAPAPANYMLALRLHDSTGFELAALDVQPTGGIYPTSAWRTGEVVADQYQLALPSGLIPGEYPLTLTLYDAATLAPAGTATLPITLTKWSPPPGTEPLHRFNDAITLYDVTLPNLIKAGDALTFTARWIVLAPEEELQARWSLVSTNGEVTTFADLPLAAEPSSEWAAGALVAGRPSFTIPFTAGPGEYEMDAQLLDAAGKPLSPAIAVGSLVVAASDRTTVLPPMQFEADATFGPIKLAGYDATLTPDTLTLTPHWQTSGPAEADYKYFVHVFNPEDESIPAQADGFPTVPTSQWFENEVVSQVVTIPLADLAPGVVYNIGVGWYDPATGNRLGERAILSQGVVRP